MDEQSALPGTLTSELLGHAHANVTGRYVAPDVARLMAEAERVSAVSAFYRDSSSDWYLGIGSQADGDPLIRLPNRSD